MNSIKCNLLPALFISTLYRLCPLSLCHLSPSVPTHCLCLHPLYLCPHPLYAWSHLLYLCIIVSLTWLWVEDQLFFHLSPLFVFNKNFLHIILSLELIMIKYYCHTQALCVSEELQHLGLWVNSLNAELPGGRRKASFRNSQPVKDEKSHPSGLLKTTHPCSSYICLLLPSPSIPPKIWGEHVWGACKPRTAKHPLCSLSSKK